VIANAGAATTTSSATTTAQAGGARIGPRRLIRRAVHGNVVVASRSGYITVAFDRGTVESVSGQRLTLREGVKRSTYKVVTLTIPSNARVRDDRKPAQLSDIKPGQRAAVIQARQTTIVIARTPRTP
jgi:hypothetical protein